jgi:hypothetical protein
MRSPSANYNKLLYVAAAMRASPQDTDVIAANFGLTDQFEAAQASKRSFVYLLDTRTPGARYFKVGRSVQPHIRLQQIQSGGGAAMPPDWEAGTTVRPLAIREGGSAIEASIHRDLGEYRVRDTEWFVGSLAVAQYVVGQDTWDTWNGAPIPDDYDFSTLAA